MFLNLNQQLLVYIRVEKGIKKSKVVNAISIGFILLDRETKLVISVPINSTANGIGGITVYITLRVNSKVGKNNQYKISAW